MASLELLSPSGFRRDGRKLTQHRLVEVDIEPLSDGVTFKSGNTIVMGRVMEDEFVQTSTTSLTVALTWAPFAFPERRLKKADRTSTVYERIVKETFEAIMQNKSNAHVTIHVQLMVLSADGGILAACINATTLALSRSGYALDDLVVASAVAHIDGITLIDPTHYEILKTDCDLTVGCLSRSRKIASLASECKITATVLMQLIEQATETSISTILPKMIAAQEAHVKYLTTLRSLVSERLAAGAK